MSVVPDDDQLPPWAHSLTAGEVARRDASSQDVTGDAQA